MELYVDSTYWFTRLIFLKGLGLIYLVAFLVAFNQFRALLGEKGILPVPEFIKHVPFARTPSLFHLHYSDQLVLTLHPEITGK